MKKRGIILIIILLVVVNISTYCGFGRATRAAMRKKEIDLWQVDSILIIKNPSHGDSIKYPWKRLTS